MSITKLKTGKYEIDLSYTQGRKRCRLRRKVYGSLKAAREWEAKLKNAIRMGELLSPDKGAQPVMFKDFAREWFETYVKANNKPSEQVAKETMLRLHLVPAFGSFMLSEISSRNIEKYKANLISRDYSPRTINIHLACLRKLFQSAVDWEVIERNPAGKIAKMKERKDAWQFLDFEDSEKFLDAVPEQWKTLFLCAMRTGLRISELIALRWRDIDFKRKVIEARNTLYRGKLYPTKSYAMREIPMTQDLVKALAGTRHLRSEFVFCGSDGKPIHRGSVRKPLQAAIKKSGVKRIRFHDIRHCFASHLVMCNVGIKKVQELLGHSSLQMTLRYSHLTPACREEAIKALEEKISTLTWSQSGHPQVV